VGVIYLWGNLAPWRPQEPAKSARNCFYVVSRPARALRLQDRIDSYPDFPKKGILFRDYAPLLRDPEALSFAADEFVAHFGADRVDAVVGLEARGFPVATAVAMRMRKGMVMIRKAGKLPGRTRSVSYEIEYGSDTMEMQAGALKAGDRALICDDLLATGGTAAAAASLVEGSGATVAGFAIVVELEALQGIKKISKYDVNVLVRY